MKKEATRRQEGVYMNKLRLIPLKQSKINDPYWNRYINLVRSDIIPYQWRILNDEVEDVETSHCIYNFKIAAGKMEGEYYGAVFQDTDLAKWIEAASYSLAVDPEESLSNLIDEAIDLIEKAQQKDGYLNTYYTIKEPGKRFTNLMRAMSCILLVILWKQQSLIIKQPERESY